MKNRPLVRRPYLPAVSTQVKWILGVVVVALLLGGTATAAKKITGTDVADSSLTGKDVRDSSLTGRDIRDRSLSARDFSESIRGPAGPEGPPGAPGPAGATGPNGFRVLTQHEGPIVPIAAFDVVTTTALCDAGELTVSGGWLQRSGTALIVVAGSVAGADPSTHRDGWTILAQEAGGGTGSFQAVAYCAPLPVSATTASAASVGSSSVLSAHRQAWKTLRKAADAMRAAKLTSHR